MGWFKKTPDLQAIRPDMGAQPQKRFGVTGKPELACPAVKWRLECFNAGDIILLEFESRVL